MTLRIGWFSTGAGAGSQRYRLLEAVAEEIRTGALDAQIAFVFCNRERGENDGTDGYLDLVESLGIPLIALSSRDFRRERAAPLSKPGEPLAPWRGEYDRRVADLVAQHSFDVGMLAGYMLIFTSEMCSRYPLLNLHPAAPGGPAGTWQDVIRSLIDARAGRSGVMIHLSTEDLDAGPVVASCSFSLRGPDIDRMWEDFADRPSASVQSAEREESRLFQEIRRRGSVREQPLVLATLHALAEGRVRIEGGQVLDAGGKTLDTGLDLTEAIDTEVSSVLHQ